ncbi:MAG: hypothetical protein ACT4PV_12395 [Planctomycetaceae bacterium]
MDNVQITFHPMTTESGGSNPVFSPIFDVSAFSKLIAFLTVQEVLGSGATVNAEIQDSMDGQSWRPAGTLSLAAVGTTRTVFSDIARFVRAKYTYSGTDPRVTFSLLGLAREF